MNLVAQRTAPADALLSAFCNPRAPEVFSAIVYSNQIWTPDPFDVSSIHSEARTAFAGLLSRAASPTPPAFGKTLLLLGEAGSGKTHLMRAFRNETHASGTGYYGYMQMTSRADNYARYALSNLIDALEQPFLHPNPASALTRLAHGLLDTLEVVSADERQVLCNDLIEPDQLAQLVDRVVDLVVQEPRFDGIDIDLIRAVLYLSSTDGRIRPRVLKWLRCEDLSGYDRAMLGDLVPRPQEHMPLKTIAGLGKLMAVIHQAALVLCVDQLEEIIDQTLVEERAERWELFRRGINTLIDISDAVPNAVIVVACLDNMFDFARPSLPQPKLDRLERDPQPTRLSSHRSPEEIELMVAQRLDVLYDEAGLHADARSPTFPYTSEQLKRLSGLRTRDVLDFCRQHRERCVHAGRWMEPDAVASAHAPPAAPSIERDQEWNDFLAAFQLPVLEEAQLAELLAASIRFLSAEMPNGVYFGAEQDGRFIPVETHGPGNIVEKLLVAVCDRRAQGNGLAKQVDEVVKRAGDTPAALVRSTSFPASDTVIAKRIATLIEPRGRWRRKVVENADWRTMAAFRAFQKPRQSDAAFAAWQKQSRPLSSVPALRGILALDKLVAAQPLTQPSNHESSETLPLPESPAPGKPDFAPPPCLARDTTLLLGHTRGISSTPVRIAPQELTMHAAFLGASGSGKTTAALTLIEQLLLSGVPAVLIDRKGDLCRYADPDAWNAALPDPARAQGRAQLRQRIAVALFTPGNTNGRPLTLPVAPADLAQLPATERDQIAGYAAASLAGMMGYKLRAPDPKLAILGKAIEVLAATPGRAVNVRDLKELVENRDEALLLAVDGFEDRHYRRLAEDLLTLILQRRRLLDDPGSEVLDMDALLGQGGLAGSGKTRLSIINTQFLGDQAAVDFWLAQFLIALDRWASKHPSPDRLQAVLLFDEADQYLPATRQPATKAPMENLLRRARSKGVGLFLATQSPGDFDYKCRDQIRTWLVGRVKEENAIKKLRPMLEAARVDAAAKLPGQEMGQFYLLREKEVIALHTEPCLIATEQVPEDRILELARTGPSPGLSRI